MKILLTHGYFLEEDPKEQQIMKPYVPLGILCISAYLVEHGFENEVFDSTFSSFKKFQEYLLESKPAVIGIYVNLMTKLNVLKQIRFIKENLPQSKVILGGPEVTHHAENFLRQGSDIIVIGEGEQTMLELCEFYSHAEISLNELAGIAFTNEKKEIERTPPREKIKNLDDLPFPNRKKVNLQLYFDAWKNKHGQSAISVSTMRGCPYTCKWCSRAVYGESYRRRSAKKVVDEIEMLQSQYSFDTIWFVDDVFTISHKWLTAFHDELMRRKISIRYECITRSDRMNEEVVRLLNESGCFRVWIGAESGSQKVIDAMDRRVDVNQVREMIQLAKNNGIEAGTFIMLGYPGEEDEDVKETLHHLKTSDPDYYTITVAYPIKGTPMYEEVESNFLQQLPWEISTDRQIDFKRKYSRKYYDYAVRWISNEMAIQKSNGSIPKFLQHKIKSVASRSLMRWEMIRS
ncbi:MAG: B12-binding domain-containing radical SAM protein [Chitinophagales bacterium]